MTIQTLLNLSHILSLCGLLTFLIPQLIQGQQDGLNKDPLGTQID